VKYRLELFFCEDLNSSGCYSGYLLRNEIVLTWYGIILRVCVALWSYLFSCIVVYDSFPRYIKKYSEVLDTANGWYLYLCWTRISKSNWFYFVTNNMYAPSIYICSLISFSIFQYVVILDLKKGNVSCEESCGFSLRSRLKYTLIYTSVFI
jgi:hypothetical protein